MSKTTGVDLLDELGSVKSMDHLRLERGKMNPGQMEKVGRLLGVMMKKIRRVFRSRAGQIYAGAPKLRRVCATCALNPATSTWKGAIQTNYGFMKSLRDQTPFICHENQPGWKGGDINLKNLQPCMAFVIVAGDRDAQRLARRADRAISRVRPVRQEVRM
jgi:hypothetical protein